MMFHLQCLVLYIGSMFLSFKFFFTLLCLFATSDLRQLPLDLAPEHISIKKSARTHMIQIQNHLSQRFLIHKVQRCPAGANSDPQVCQRLKALPKSRVSQSSTKVMWRLAPDDMCLRQFKAQISSAHEPARAMNTMRHNTKKLTAPLELRT
jgi:hypothetical protein